MIEISSQYESNRFDFLLRVNAEESRVKRIEDSRTSQISDLLSVGILGFRGIRTGVSRLESVSPVEVDDAWLSQTAVTTIPQWGSHG